MEKSEQHKLFLFDLGGVIINIDWNLSFEAFSKLLNIPIPIAKKMIEANPSFLKYELGHITSTEFFEKVKAEFDLEISYIELRKAFNIMLLDIPDERIRLIEILREKGYVVACLSNTNAMHMERFDEILNQNSSYSGIKDLMDQCFLSHEIGLKKPGIKAFTEVLEKTGTIPEEILYFDDLEENIKTARSLGIQSQLVSKIPVDKLIIN